MGLFKKKKHIATIFIFHPIIESNLTDFYKDYKELVCEYDNDTKTLKINKECIKIEYMKAILKYLEENVINENGMTIQNILKNK